jgi:Ca-activated chloride channel homolog
VNGIPHVASPGWLLLLLLLPLLAWWRHRRQRLDGAAGALTYSRLPGAGEGRRRGAGIPLHWAFYCRLAALALMTLALARFQLGYAWEESLTEGIDIAIALDLSASMGATDFDPDDRLTVAKDVVRRFIEGRPGDRLALVAFAGTAMARTPLTTDRTMLTRMVDGLALYTLPDGTAIGLALANSASRLKTSEAASRIVILVTDGVNNTGEIDPVSAAAVCDGLGIKVYTVGVGTDGLVEVPIPTRDPLTGRAVMTRTTMENQLDEELLQRIAERTGGEYFRATDAESLERIFTTIDQLETTPLTVERFVRYEELYPPLAWGALGLLLLPLAAVPAGWSAEP